MRCVELRGALVWDGVCSFLLLWIVVLAVDLCVLGIGLKVEVEYTGEGDGNFVDAE